MRVAGKWPDDDVCVVRRFDTRRAGKTDTVTSSNQRQHEIMRGDPFGHGDGGIDRGEQAFQLSTAPFTKLGMTEDQGVLHDLVEWNMLVSQ